MMKALNVKLEDINVNMIKRYDEKVEETEEFKNLKCVISKTFRLKSLLSVKMKDNYYMLIKMLDVCCGVISENKYTLKL